MKINTLPLFIKKILRGKFAKMLVFSPEKVYTFVTLKIVFGPTIAAQ